MRAKDVDSVVELCEKMVKRNFVPKTRTVVLLMKFFCKSRRPNLGLELRGYLYIKMERRHCPRGRALDLLATGLCAHENVGEDFDCARQMLERGRHTSEAVFRMLERFLAQGGEMEKLRERNELIKQLKKVLPPSRGHAAGILSTRLKELM
ncbi:hypothetical protein RHGRI_013482 [Rhododendron griersonianum]|uniref:Pentatricopeptide repeat-containing protein n=1 Tax=Rhododendron griersonianum TaxID=479676 RepID=A0AAV6K604_9ERIC|nr:hypothetical protein RHGRI_013482 [Rhododendron griersonianum]